MKPLPMSLAPADAFQELLERMLKYEYNNKRG